MKKRLHWYEVRRGSPFALCENAIWNFKTTRQTKHLQFDRFAWLIATGSELASPSSLYACLIGPGVKLEVL